jgi:2-polyprenyl-3-methyl-5-hydroxy-6-metoxy-1,4-benzoquinol methylase
MAQDPAGISADAQVARIFEWRRGFNTIHLIDLGIRVGVFKAFAEAPDATAGEIASKLGLNAHYVDVWCKTAFGMELLDAADSAQGPRYRLAPHFDSILAAPGHPRYLGGYVRLGTDVAAQDFRRCVAAFATGAVKPFQGRGDEFNQAIAESTWGLQVVTAKKILPGLDGLPAGLEGGSVLEVGCGTGNLLVQLAKAFPKARVIGVDIEADSLAAARAKLAHAGLSERAEVRQGTVADTVTPGSVDAVVMVEVLHEIGAGIRPQVVRECGAALKPGGWMVIVDETYPTTLEEMRRPEFKFPLMTGFEELLWGNVIPTREEQERLLREAGLTGEIRRSLIGEGFTVLATRKPGAG